MKDSLDSLFILFFYHKNKIAATCDPKDFASDGYTLRQQLLERNTELFIVLTMYNVSIFPGNMIKYNPIRIPRPISTNQHYFLYYLH